MTQKRMSAAEARAQLAPAAKPSKYRNTPVTVDGIRFDSKREAARYVELRRMEESGEISHLERQPSFKLYCGREPVLIRSEGYPNGRHAIATFDFAYFDGNRRVIEDVKGGKATQTEAYKLRKALVEAMHPMTRIVEVF